MSMPFCDSLSGEGDVIDIQRLLVQLFELEAQVGDVFLSRIDATFFCRPARSVPSESQLGIHHGSRG